MKLNEKEKINKMAQSKKEREGISFRTTLLNQIQDYLDGKISAEEYYEQAELFYTQYASVYKNLAFHKYFMETVPDACLFYIDEPGLSPEIKEEKFRKELQEAYETLQKL